MKTLLSSKRHHYLGRISILLILVGLIVGMVGCGGDQSTATKIQDWYGLDAIRENLGGNYLLMNDLDSTTAGYEELASTTANGGKGWEPIGTSDNPFTGILDGQGYEIRDLFTNRPDEDYVGLFGYVGEAGAIRDIGARNVVVTGNDCVGGLVGYNDGTVSDCYSIGSVIGEERVGGLAGYDSGNTVSNSYYNYDESLINGENIITTGALSDEDFDQWLTQGKFLDVNESLTQENGYYLINDVSDFKQLLAFGQNATLKFRLTNDLDLSDEPNFYIPYLAGEFDGNGHIISNLSLNLDVVSPLGLFGYLILGGNITEVGVENVNITGDLCVGGLVGYSLGTVSNSHATGSVTGWLVVGGLVGRNDGGIVSDSYATGSVTGWLVVGGLVGDNTEGGTVSNSYSTSSVTGDDHVGGLVGQHCFGADVSNSYSTGSVAGNEGVGGLVGVSIEATVSNSFSNGNVTGNAGSNRCVGGLMGFNSGTVSDCHSTGSVTSDGVCVGGLVGDNSFGGTVSNSYSTGSMTGDDHVGGLVGQNCASVSNSYSTGNVTGENHVGGLVGANVEEGTVSNSYSTGSVTGDWSVGGLVGGNADEGTVGNSFWDTETSGQTTSDGGTGKTTAEMQDVTTFTDTEMEGLDDPWDITAVALSETNPSYIWNIVNGATYPFLSWET